jgi:hypothetical protein
MVLTVSFVLSPVTGLSCHRRSHELLRENLTPASGRQDHTTSPSAKSALVFSTIGVHRIPLLTSVTIAKRPSFRSGTKWQLPLFCRAVKQISENPKSLANATV